MSSFLCDHRDYVYLKIPFRKLKKVTLFCISEITDDMFCTEFVQSIKLKDGNFTM